MDKYTILIDENEKISFMNENGSIDNPYDILSLAKLFGCRITAELDIEYAKDKHGKVCYSYYKSRKYYLIIGE